MSIALPRYLPTYLLAASIAEIFGRYTLFIPLYPLGMAAECYLMYHAASSAQDTLVAGVWYFCLLIYAPGMTELPNRTYFDGQTWS